MRPIPFLIILLLLVQACKVREPQKSEEMSGLGWKLVDKYRNGGTKIKPNQVNEIMGVFNKALQLDKKNYGARLGRGAAYYYLGRYDDAIKDYKWVADHFPKVTQSYINLGGAYEAKNDTASALKMYRKAIEINPTHYSAYTNIGTLYVDNKKYNEAIPYFNKAINGGGPSLAMAYTNRGAAYKELEQYERSIVDYNKAIRIDSTAYAAYEGLGQVHYRMKKNNEAVSYFKKALRHDSTRYHSLFGIALAYEKLGMDNKAADAYRYTIRHHPDRPDAYYNLGCMYVASAPETALMYFNLTLQHDSFYPGAYHGRGNVYCDRRDYNAALAEYNKALTIDPQYYWALNSRGNVYLNQKKYVNALADYQKTTEIAPDFAVGFSNKGLALKRLNRLDEARTTLFKALSLDSFNKKTLCELGDFYDHIDLADSALICFEKAISLDTTYSVAYHNRARTNHFKKKELKKALSDYLIAERLDTTVSELYNNFGMLYTDLKEYGPAITCFLKAIRLKPELTYAYNNLANCYFNKGETANACKYWQQALNHGYVYDPKWKKEYDIDDPKELIQKHCK